MDRVVNSLLWPEVPGFILYLVWIGAAHKVDTSEDIGKDKSSVRIDSGSQSLLIDIESHLILALSLSEIFH